MLIPGFCAVCSAMVLILAANPVTGLAWCVRTKNQSAPNTPAARRCMFSIAPGKAGAGLNQVLN